MERLRNAKQTPIVHVDSITPARVMQGYISQQANQKTLKPLSPAGYGVKRMDVFHFIWCHNGKGPSQDFQDEMTALWKGFSRTTNKRKMRAIRQPRINAQGNGDDDDDGDSDSTSGSDADDAEDDDDHD
jgi:hypothetical protein